MGRRVNSVNYTDQFFTVPHEYDGLELSVTSGRVPAWLRGKLVRNGPGSYHIGRSQVQHWFDGLAMLQGFEFKDGRVLYDNRFLRSKSYCEGRDKGRNPYKMFYTEADYNPVSAFINWFRAPRTSGNTSVSVLQLGDAYYAMTETNPQTQFDLHSLATLDVGSFTDQAPAAHGILTTPHPHFDARRKQLINVNIKLGKTSEYRYFAVDAKTHKPALIGVREVDLPAYLHAFGLTENYIVHVEPPLVVFPLRMRFGNLPYIRCYQWKPERGTRITLLSRDSGKVVNQAVTEPGFLFHFANCFEEDGHVAMDIAWKDDAKVVFGLTLDKIESGAAHPSDGKSPLLRYRMPLDGKSIEKEILSDTYIEFPTINYGSHNCRPYRYVYGVGLHDPQGDDFDNQVIKIDTHNGGCRHWYLEGYYAGEPIFVPQPNAGHEDDGIVMSLVCNFDSRKPFLLLLNAEDLSEIARVELPHQVPMGFHGQYFPFSRNGA